MKLSSLAIAIAIAALALAGPAIAHTDEYLDTVQAPNGGQLRMAGSYHYELVVGAEGAGAQARTLVVYVTDHGDAKIGTAGAEGSVVVLSQGRKTKADLQPDGENRLKGVATFTPAPDMKVVVAVRLAGQPPAQARFMPLKLRPATAGPAR